MGWVLSSSQTKKDQKNQKNQGVCHISFELAFWGYWITDEKNTGNTSLIQVLEDTTASKPNKQNEIHHFNQVLYMKEKYGFQMQLTMNSVWLFASKNMPSKKKDNRDELQPTSNPCPIASKFDTNQFAFMQRWVFQACFNQVFNLPYKLLSRWLLHSSSTFRCWVHITLSCCYLWFHNDWRRRNCKSCLWKLHCLHTERCGELWTTCTCSSGCS